MLTPPPAQVGNRVDHKELQPNPAAICDSGAKETVACSPQAGKKLEAAGGFYQPLSGGDLRARGVLDFESGIEIECVRGEVREHAEMRELLVQAVATARAAAAQAGRGELEPRPRTCAYRGGCMYPTICRCEA